MVRTMPAKDFGDAPAKPADVPPVPKKQKAEIIDLPPRQVIKRREDLEKIEKRDKGKTLD